MRRGDTMIKLNLLCDLKEVESMETLHIVIQHHLQNPQETCHPLRQILLGYHYCSGCLRP